MKKVSVIIPAYNVENTIDRCIDSVTGQTYNDLEIICIDDGSTDGTFAKIQGKALADNRIIVYRKPNGGYGSTINLGIEKATGDFIAIVESDDHAERQMIETLVRCAEKMQADVVKANYYEYYLDGTKVKNDYLQLFHENEIYTNIVLLCTLGPAIWAGLYKRSFLIENDIWLLDSPGASFQDTGFSFKVMVNIPKVAFVKDALLNYTMDNSKSSVHDREKVFCICNEFEEIKYYLVKHNIYNRMGICNIHQYYTYLWNLKRLEKVKKIAFALKAHYEFLEQNDNGFVVESYYSKSDYKKISLWIKDILGFINTYIADGENFCGRSIYDLIEFIISLDSSSVVIYDTGKNNDMYDGLYEKVVKICIAECSEPSQGNCLLLKKKDKSLMRNLILLETMSNKGKRIAEWLRGNKVNSFICLNKYNINNFDPG